jgi:hypothetical protein
MRHKQPYRLRHRPPRHPLPLVALELLVHSTMATPKAIVGVLSIGQMGLGFAKLLLAHDFHVITNVSDRSSATQERARAASIECVSSDSELVAKADCT